MLQSISPQSDSKGSEGSTHCMDAKCISCGKKLLINTSLIRRIIGGSMVGGAALGWVTYAFAGLLGFYGGAALIAVALLAGGSTVLSGKDFGAVVQVGRKITDVLNDRKFPCADCGSVNWTFAGYEDNEVITGDAHKVELENALREARLELLIASGFLCYYVVNETFKRKLEATLARGVTVTLVFSDARSHSNWNASGYSAALQLLENLYEKHRNLRLIQKHTHQKGMVVDQQYAIVGSFNFLCNDRVDKDETSAKVSDKASIDRLKKEFLMG